VIERDETRAHDVREKKTKKKIVRRRRPTADD